jgi:hypothetical protein
MNKLEELQKAAAVARTNWQWDELRAIERAILIETGVLVETAETLPAAPVLERQALPWIPEVEPAAPEALDSDTEPASDDDVGDEEAGDTKPSTKRGRSRRGK